MGKQAVLIALCSVLLLVAGSFVSAKDFPQTGAAAGSGAVATRVPVDDAADMGGMDRLGPIRQDLPVVPVLQVVPRTTTGTGPSTPVGDRACPGKDPCGP